MTANLRQHHNNHSNTKNSNNGYINDNKK